MSFCKHCVSGVVHEGTATGKIEKINGIETYIATPEKDYPKQKAVLYFTDIFGIQLNNAKLICDSFASNGFQASRRNQIETGSPIDSCFQRCSFDLMRDWAPRHGAAQTRPHIDSFLKGLLERGVSEYAVVGYCYGARYAFDLAIENFPGLKAIAVAHPSLLKVPEDHHALMEKSKVPVLMNTCEDDYMYPVEKQKKGDEILGDGKYAPGYLRTYWPGCTHGFAVRGDLSKPEVKAGKEGAFKATVDWFLKYL
ncbi:alpha/beta-hydrolase [Auriculariales sp. MPI-PUGE-AT-0066]|nr:alpha/beta-hydrolase [Auriculariales sp. MPI-PUGE-AT-0066]